MARYASGKPLAERKRSPRWGVPQTPIRTAAKSQKYGGSNIEKNKKQPNRTRPFSYSFRVSKDEQKILDEKLSACGMGKADFLIRALSDKPIVSIDNGYEILTELKRQGNNLNQAVKNTHFGYATEREILSAVDECKKVYRKLYEALGGSA